MTQRAIRLSVLLAMAVGGCAGSNATVREEAQMEAAEEHAEKHVDTVERQREYEVNRAQARAELQEDAVEHEEDRNVYYSNASSRLDTIAVRIDEVEHKADIKEGPEKTEFQEELTVAKEQHGALQQEVNDMKSVPEAEWEQRQAKMDDGLEQLEERVESLLSQIEEA